MEVEIPDAMVEYEADNLVNDMAQRLQAQGIPFDQYLAMTGMTDVYKIQDLRPPGHRHPPPPDHLA